MSKIFERLWRQHVDSLAIWLCYQFETWQQLEAFFELSAPERCACFPGKGFEQVSESDWTAIKQRALAAAPGKQRRQHKCPSCGLVVVVERDSGTVIASHEVPQCPWFENMLRTEMGTPDSVELASLEVDP